MAASHAKKVKASLMLTKCVLIEHFLDLAKTLYPSARVVKNSIIDAHASLVKGLNTMSIVTLEPPSIMYMSNLILSPEIT